ncbi:MAG: AAA family ATPase [Verrucomicrobiota bacterium]
MTDRKDNDNEKSVEESLREMLRRVNFAFTGGTSGGEDPGTGQSENEEPEHGIQEALETIREFSLKPRDIKKHLDRFVIKQDEAKKALSVAICDHFNHVRRCIDDPDEAEKDYAKHNIMLIGPTGVGKTYLMRCIARLIGVPFIKADATKFSETGYVGHDTEDLVRDLVKVAGGNAELAQYGIIYVDEIDKIAAQSSGGGKDVSGRGVQVNLLKLMEETEVSLVSQTDIVGQMRAVMDIQKGKDGGKQTINTRHMLFIVSGVFDKLGEQVRRRIESSKIGFMSAAKSAAENEEYLKQVRTGDFVEYGFEPEFVGRLPIRVVCDPLEIDDLEQIMLNSEGSILSQYRKDFEGYDIDVDIDSDAVRAIAEKAHREKTGARGLMTVCERVFRDFKFEIPSASLRSLSIGRDAVENSAASVGRLLADKSGAQEEGIRNDIRRFQEFFEKEHGIKLTFDKTAVREVIDRCAREEKSARDFMDRNFHDFEYGFKLIARNTGKNKFRITAAFVRNPSEALSKRIAKSVKKQNS